MLAVRASPAARQAGEEAASAPLAQPIGQPVAGAGQDLPHVGGGRSEARAVASVDEAWLPGTSCLRLPGLLSWAQVERVYLPLGGHGLELGVVLRGAASERHFSVQGEKKEFLFSYSECEGVEEK